MTLDSRLRFSLKAGAWAGWMLLDGCWMDVAFHFSHRLSFSFHLL